MMISRFRYRNKPAIMGNVVDVTARKKAEDALRESEKFNSILLENTPNPIIVHDPDTTIKYVNRAVVELLGFSAKELVGVKAPHPWWTELTKCKTRKDLLKILHKKLVREEEVFRNKNGQRLYVEIN